MVKSKNSVEVLIERVNTLAPYVGTSQPIKVDLAQRRVYIPENPFMTTFRQRAELFGTKRENFIAFLGNQGEIRYLSLWDYLPNGQDPSGLLTLRIAKGNKGRIYLPPNTKLLEGEVVEVGKTDHIEIYHLNDWKKLKG